MGPLGPWTHLDKLSSWHNLYIGSLASGVRTLVVEKTKWKSMKLFTPSSQDSKSKIILPLRGMRESTSTSQGLTHEKVVVLLCLHLISSVWPLQKPDDHGRWQIPTHLNQLEAPTEVVLPDVVSLLKWIDLDSGIWYEATDLVIWEIFFPPLISERRIENSWYSLGMDSRTHSWSYSGLWYLFCPLPQYSSKKSRPSEHSESNPDILHWWRQAN